MITFLARHPQATPEHFGMIPTMLCDSDPRPASEQLDAGYAVAGGWQPMPKFTMGDGDVLLYPGDDPLEPIAELLLRDERVVIYPYSIVAIIQPDGSFTAARME